MERPLRTLALQEQQRKFIQILDYLQTAPNQWVSLRRLDELVAGASLAAFPRSFFTALLESLGSTRSANDSSVFTSYRVRFENPAKQQIPSGGDETSKREKRTRAEGDNVKDETNEEDSSADDEDGDGTDSDELDAEASDALTRALSRMTGHAAAAAAASKTAKGRQLDDGFLGCVLLQCHLAALATDEELLAKLAAAHGRGRRRTFGVGLASFQEDDATIAVIERCVRNQSVYCLGDDTKRATSFVSEKTAQLMSAGESLETGDVSSRSLVEGIVTVGSWAMKGPVDVCHSFHEMEVGAGKGEIAEAPKVRKGAIPVWHDGMPDVIPFGKLLRISLRRKPIDGIPPNSPLAVLNNTPTAAAGTTTCVLIVSTVVRGQEDKGQPIRFADDGRAVLRRVGDAAELTCWATENKLVRGSIALLLEAKTQTTTANPPPLPPPAAAASTAAAMGSGVLRLPKSIDSCVSPVIVDPAFTFPKGNPGKKEKIVLYHAQSQPPSFLSTSLLLRNAAGRTINEGAEEQAEDEDKGEQEDATRVLLVGGTKDWWVGPCKEYELVIASVSLSATETESQQQQQQQRMNKNPVASLRKLLEEEGDTDESGVLRGCFGAAASQSQSQQQQQRQQQQRWKRLTGNRFRLHNRHMINAGINFAQPYRPSPGN